MWGMQEDTRGTGVPEVGYLHREQDRCTQTEARPLLPDDRMGG